MGLKYEYREAIDQFRSRLCSNIKIRHMLPDLIGTITYEESDDLQKLSQDKALNSEFIRILTTRSDEDFEKFCQLLRKSDSNTSKALGNDLQKATKTGNN